MNKMKKQTIPLLIILLLTSMLTLKAQERRSNPIISHMFTADPSAHVWEDGRLYVYPSTDVAPPKGYRKMDGYHVFSTDDMITWKDHGEILHSRQVEWGREEGGFMWAPDCAYRDGVYYYYFPHLTETDFKGNWNIGVATSTKPASDFKLQGYVKGIKPLIDPCVFIDDDQQAYLYQGSHNAYVTKLKENMIDVDGKPQKIEGLDGFREGLFVFKRNGIYYAIYPDDFPKYNKMRYAMSDSPLGPFKNNEVFIGSTDVITMHGSVVEFKGQWYVFYHNGNLSGGVATNRSVCFDPIYFNEDGTIQMVKQTLGVQLPTFHNDINFNEMFGTLPVGNFKMDDLKKEGILPKAISSIQIPKGFAVECFEKNNFKGKSWYFEEDRINLNDLDCNDAICSVKISKINAIENLIKNPSFEVSTQKQIKHWKSRKPESYSKHFDNSVKGYYVLQYKGKASPKDMIQKVKIKPNTEYELSVSLKVDEGTKGKVIFDTKGNFDDTCKFELDTSKKAGKWMKYKAVFNSGKQSLLNLRCITSSDFDGACYWDNVVLQEK